MIFIYINFAPSKNFSKIIPLRLIAFKILASLKFISPKIALFSKIFMENSLSFLLSYRLMYFSYILFCSSRLSYICNLFSILVIQIIRNNLRRFGTTSDLHKIVGGCKISRKNYIMLLRHNCSPLKSHCTKGNFNMWRVW